MSKKMGRPKLPKGNAKAELFALKISAGQSKNIDLAAKKSGLSKPDWARAVLKDAAQDQRIPVICPDAMKYDQKPATFYFMDGKERVPLKGVFRVWIEPTYVAIAVEGMYEKGRYTQFFNVPQAGVDSIRPLSGEAESWEVQQPMFFAPKR